MVGSDPIWQTTGPSFGTAGLAPSEAGEGIRPGVLMPSGASSMIFTKPLEDIT
jgi:hypothetical protein